LTRDNLAKRKKVDDKKCLICLEEETVQHLFFEYVVAKQCWRLMSEILNVRIENSLADIGSLWFSSKRNVVVNIITSATLWCIWKLRNECCFQHIGWRSMDILLYRICRVLQNWVILCPQEKREQLLGYISKIKTAARMVF
jgi:hypothetical protein